jgi:hypothetical protein
VEVFEILVDIVSLYLYSKEKKMSDSITATNLAVDIGMGYMAVSSLTSSDSTPTTKLLVAGAGAIGGHYMYKSFIDDVPGAIEHPWQSMKDVLSGKGSLGEDLATAGMGYGAYKGGSAAYNYATQGGTASAEEAAEVGAETTAEATEIATTTAEVATTATESVGVGAEILGGLETVGEFLPFLLI